MLPAAPAAVGQMRRRATEFAIAAGAAEEVVGRIAFAVSEAVTNVVLHAYTGQDGDGTVRVTCRVEGERVIVAVIDQGAGLAPRRDSPGIGHGLTIVGALAETLDIVPGPDGRGTVVRMGFGPETPPEAPPGIEVLCALALETLADASCVDLVRDGVLRRASAEVVDEPDLSQWLRETAPPAKPGTATWAALREGGARLVIHDPAVPRSPGGPGERLGLTWWIAVALETAAGAPEALWGFGGRGGGRAVPSEKVLGILADAARGNLAHPAERAMLRGQLVAA